MLRQTQGPKSKAKQTLATRKCHWYLNNMSAYKYSKLQLWRAYASVYKIDIICLSETNLDSRIDGESLESLGYHLTPSDHPSNKNRDGICISVKVFDICL